MNPKLKQGMAPEDQDWMTKEDIKKLHRETKPRRFNREVTAKQVDDAKAHVEVFRNLNPGTTWDQADEILAALDAIALYKAAYKEVLKRDRRTRTELYELRAENVLLDEQFKNIERSEAARHRNNKALADELNAQYRDGNWYMPYFHHDGPDEMLTIANWRLKCRNAAKKIRNPNKTKKKKK